MTLSAVQHARVFNYCKSFMGPQHPAAVWTLCSPASYPAVVISPYSGSASRSASSMFSSSVGFFCSTSTVQDSQQEEQHTETSQRHCRTAGCVPSAGKSPHTSSAARMPTAWHMGTRGVCAVSLHGSLWGKQLQDGWIAQKKREPWQPAAGTDTGHMICDRRRWQPKTSTAGVLLYSLLCPLVTSCCSFPYFSSMVTESTCNHLGVHAAKYTCWKDANVMHTLARACPCHASPPPPPTPSLPRLAAVRTAAPTPRASDTHMGPGLGTIAPGLPATAAAPWGWSGRAPPQ